jgi:hypothetical protein
MPGAAGAASPSGGAGAAGQQQDEAWDLSAGVRLGGAIRDASRAELGIVLSVGVAPNKLLAKLVRAVRLTRFDRRSDLSASTAGLGLHREGARAGHLRAPTKPTMLAEPLRTPSPGEPRRQARWPAGG